MVIRENLFHFFDLKGKRSGRSIKEKEMDFLTVDEIAIPNAP
jgi:hypothetical protein